MLYLQCQLHFMCFSCLARPDNHRSVRGASNGECKCECPPYQNDHLHQSDHDHNHDHKHRPHPPQDDRHILHSPKYLTLQDDDTTHSVNISMTAVQSVLNDSTNGQVVEHLKTVLFNVWFTIWQAYSFDDEYQVMVQSLHVKEYKMDYTLFSSNVTLSWDDQTGKSSSVIFQVFKRCPVCISSFPAIHTHSSKTTHPSIPDMYMHISYHPSIHPSSIHLSMHALGQVRCSIQSYIW